MSMREVFLTFDVEGPPFSEDFMGHEVLKALLKILRLLDKYELRGFFFITGSVVGEISDCPEVLRLLERHEIGYHSSSHSIRPMIFEYTDVENYDEAVETSLKRETSRIDPSTGRISGKGGILMLRESFPDKRIESFRAPFLCWIPPHLEALRKLNFKFDFSTGICQNPEYGQVQYKGITFYPPPLPVDSGTSPIGYVETFSKKRLFPNLLLSNFLKRECTVLLKHPAVLVYRRPNRIRQQDCEPLLISMRIRSRHHMEVASLFLSTELLFLELSLLQEIGLVKVTPRLKITSTLRNLKEVNLRTVYEMSMRAPRRLFGFKPRFLLSHFCKFFETSI